MSYQLQATPARRPSWRGILAGLLMGLVVWFAMFSLALILSSFLSLDLQGASITGGIYTIVTALLSAFTAGYFAVKASAPEALFGDGVEILPKDATLTGMLTAASIVVITTWLAVSGLTSMVKTAGNVAGATVSAVGSTAGAVGNAAGSVIGATTNLATSGATTSENGNKTDNNIQAVYKKITGNISRDDIESWIAKNNSNLNKEQVTATANVLDDMVNKTKNQVDDMDFMDVETWKHLDEYAKNRLTQIENVIKGPELIQRLKKEGLSETQALEVQKETLTTYQEYKVKTEQSVADAKQKVEETKVKAQKAMEDAKETARKTALYTGLFGLLSMFITFLASIAGAKKAAATYRLDRPIVVSRTTNTNNSLS